jgi:hypothetical protein
MKKLSNRDWAIAIIIGLFSFLLGWAVKAFVDGSKEPITIENPVNEALKKRSDSLEAVVAQRDLIIANNDKQQDIHDSIIINNNKALKKDYDKIKNLDDSTRARYIDSVLRSAHIR